MTYDSVGKEFSFLTKLGTIESMPNRNERNYRPKAWTWLEPDAEPGASHLPIDPLAGMVLRGGPDDEGRFVVTHQTESDAQPKLWVGDRRHWTEVPPKP